MTDPAPTNADLLRFRNDMEEAARFRRRWQFTERVASRELVRTFGLDIGDFVEIRVPSIDPLRPKPVRGVVERARLREQPSRKFAVLIIREFTKAGIPRAGRTQVAMDGSANIITVTSRDGDLIEDRARRLFPSSAKEVEDARLRLDVDVW